VQFIIGLPLPSYALLGLSAFVAIAFVGCIFQLFCKRSSNLLVARNVYYHFWASILNLQAKVNERELKNIPEVDLCTDIASGHRCPNPNNLPSFACPDDVPAAPVLGVPATAAIFALSGPTWVFLFVACIKKGQAEADAEDRRDP
jgi:hypothetical protein